MKERPSREERLIGNYSTEVQTFLSEIATHIIRFKVEKRIMDPIRGIVPYQRFLSILMAVPVSGICMACNVWLAQLWWVG